MHYRLVDPGVAGWPIDGLRFLEIDQAAAGIRRTVIEEVRQLWGAAPAPDEESGT